MPASAWKRSGVAIMALFFVFPGHTQTLRTIYSFTGPPDGANPSWGPVFDAQGNLWGTTSRGTVYKLTPSGNRWNEDTVYTFPGPGDTSSSGFTFDQQGNLYNTTVQNGAYGQGSVFKITPAGTESTVYNFTGGTDGGPPSLENLLRDALGNFYGTAGGGAHGAGVVFEITPSGTETVLYSFTGGLDGNGPNGDLVLDAQGNLYGTTSNGGTYSVGTVFKVTPGGIETVLHNFRGDGATFTDGKNPQGGLVADQYGNLYGVTENGGTNHDGTVFGVTPSGVYKILYNFLGGTVHGANPVGPLTIDGQGNLYGVTFYGAGTVYRVTPSGTQKVLWNFGPSVSQSKYPMPGLIWDAQGNLYGVTYGGNHDNGTVFELTP